MNLNRMIDKEYINSLNKELIYPVNISLFKEGYKRNKPSYIRLTDFENDYKFNVKFGKGNLINKQKNYCSYI